MENDIQARGVDAHFRGKHGANTSPQQQFDRATQAIDPRTGIQALKSNGQPKLPPSATRYFSARDQINSIERAMNIMRRTGNRDFAQEPINFISKVGEGYNKHGVHRTTNSVTTKIDPATGLPYTNFPNYK